MKNDIYQDFVNTAYYTKWNKRFFKIYWSVFFVFTVVLIIMLLFKGYTEGVAAFRKAFFSYFLPQTVIIGILLPVSHVVYSVVITRLKPVIQSCYTLAVYISLCSVIIAINLHLNMVYSIYVGPIMLSICYLDRRVVNFTCILCTVAFLLIRYKYILTIAPVYINDPTPNEIIIGFCMLIIGYLIAQLLLMNIYEAVEMIKHLAVEREKLKHELNRDPFTKLLNHIVLYERLDECITRSKVTGASNFFFSFIIMDVDNFKNINDEYGHAVGDIVLLKIVEIINEEISDEDLSFRFGGEEFAIICKKHLEDAVELSERIRKRLESYTFPQIENRNVTASLGVSEYENSFGGRREFFSSADKALYRAKQEGKNRTCAAKLLNA